MKDCVACHVGIKERKVKSFRGSFAHAMHIDEEEKTCADCHDLAAPPPGVKKDACEECHDE